MNRLIGLMVLVLVTLGALGNGPAPQVTQAAPTTQQNVTDPCAVSPFGEQIVVAGEDEPFLSFSVGNNVRHDRLNVAANNRLERQSAFPTTSTPERANVRELTSTSGDFTGDGFAEFVQIYTNEDDSFRRIVHSRSGVTELRSPAAVPYTSLAVAAGKITGAADGSEQIAFAGARGGELNVLVTNPLSETALGSWRLGTGDFADPSQIAVAVGDFNGNGLNDEIAVVYRSGTDNAIRGVVLAHDPSVGTSGQTFNMRVLATFSLTTGDFTELRVAAGNIDDDRNAEIIVAVERIQNPGAGSELRLGVRVVAYKLDRGTIDQVPNADWSFQEQTDELALATGDLDGDGRDEIAVGFNAISGEPGLTIYMLDEQLDGSLMSYAFWRDNTPARSPAAGLSLAVGDLDRDTLREIVVAFRAGSQLHTLQLAPDHEPMPATLRLARALADASAGRNTAERIALHLNDWDNNALIGHFTPAPAGERNPACAVTDPEIRSVVFTAPYWRELQQDSYRYFYLGKGTTSSVEQNTTVSYERSETFSAYFGFGLSTDAFSASAKVTAEREYSFSQTSGSGTEETVTLGEEYGNNESFVIFDESRHYCYNYAVREGENDQGRVRFCTYRPTATTQDAIALDAWDAGYGPLTTGVAPGNRAAPQWAPVGRDWASLTLFREQQTVQSDGAVTAMSGRAVDGITDGDSADKTSFTANQPAPWWQVDLGSLQEITKIRLWNSTGACGDAPCSARLNNFYVFVSDVDLRDLPNGPPAELAAAVRARGGHVAFYDGTAGEVTNLLTLRANPSDPSNPLPVIGRYIRVQLRDAGVLALAEVQAFGRNQVDPDRYPRSVRDPDGGVYTDTNGIRRYRPGTDGWFEAELYDAATDSWKWRRVRGNLLWSGAEFGVNQNKILGPDSVTQTWSLSTDASTSRTTGEAYGHSSQIGIEFDVEVGYIGQIQFGGGYAKSRGITQEEAQTVSLGQSFEIGGTAEGLFSRELSQCAYSFQPFYYEVHEESSQGFEHRFLTVDYSVPQPATAGDAGLNRANPALDACRPEAPTFPGPGPTGNFSVYLPLLRR